MGKPVDIEPREPSGRPSRSGNPREFPPTKIKRLRDAAVEGKSDARWGSELGRLFLDDKIDAAMFIAGERWAELAYRYQMAIGARGTPRSAALERGMPAEPPDPDSDEGARRSARERATMVRMAEASEALLGEDGGIVPYTVVRAVCEHDEAAVGDELINLKLGLTALVTHWRLNVTPRGGNGRSAR